MTARLRTLFAVAVATAWLSWAAPAAAQKDETKPAAPAGAIPADGAYRIGEVDEQPHLQNAGEVAREIERHYPRRLLRAGITGNVVLRFRIAPDGGVDRSSLAVVSSTNAAFEEPAATAAVRMRFSPAMLGGRPVAVWVALPIRFGLSDIPPPPLAPSRPANPSPNR